MKILLQIMLFVMPLLSFTQVDTVARLYSFGGVNNDVAEEIKATSDGGYIVIGSTSSNSWGNTDGYLLKVDSNCTYQWSKALGGANNDWGYAIEETHDKGFIIALSSNSYGNGGYDAVLMKRDSLGNYQWKKTYGGNDWDFAYDVTQTYDSGYVFCGETFNNTQGYSDVWVVKTNINGDTLWTQTIGGSLVDKGNSVIETSDSSIVVAGITNTTTDSTQIYLLKFSKNGVLQWDSIYGDSLYENANSVIETNNGDYIVAAHTTSKSTGVDQDYLIKGISPNGNSLWDFVIVNGPVPTPDDEDAFDLVQLANQKILITGYSKTGGSSKNIIFYHLNSNGTWGGGSSVIATNDDDYLKSIAIGVDGSMVGAGVSKTFGSGLEDVLLAKLDTIYSGQDTAVLSMNDTIPLNIRKYSLPNKLQITPNPIDNYFFINLRYIEKIEKIEKIELYNLLGKKLHLSYSSNRVDVGRISSGTYILMVYTSKSLYQQKVIKY